MRSRKFKIGIGFLVFSLVLVSFGFRQEFFAAAASEIHNPRFQLVFEVNPELQLLQEGVAKRIERYSFTSAVAITDLQTEETISVNGDTALLPGCTMNLFVLIRVVKDLELGLYPEEDVGELISITIRDSNATTAFLLVQKIGDGDAAEGLRKVNEMIGELGLESAVFDHPPAYGSVVSLYGSVNNYITVVDMNRLLAKLYYNEILSPEWTDYLLEKMTHVKLGLNYLIPAGVGTGAVVSHKNGFFPYIYGFVDNDIGIVRFERDGQQYAYAISFFTQEVPVKYTDEIVLGQAISRLVWEYFDNKYNSKP